MSTPASLPSRAAVVIVGGGMAGLSCAASLARRGVRDVVLLEAQTLAHAKASSYGAVSYTHLTLPTKRIV